MGQRSLTPGPVESRILALAGIHGEPLKRRYVAATLWPAAPPSVAAGRLRSALGRLRGLAPRLVRAGGDLSLSDGVGCDVRDLEQWARDVRAGGRELPEPGTGLLLPYWHDPWVQLHRERLLQLRCDALELLSARLRASGRHDHAAAAGREAVRLGPLRESARRALIRALGAAGRHDAVRREYDDYRAALRRELGLEPSPHLDKVMAELGVLPSHGGDAAVTPAS